MEVTCLEATGGYQVISELEEVNRLHGFHCIETICGNSQDSISAAYSMDQ